MSAWKLVPVAVLCYLFSTVSQAHKPSDSYLTLTQGDHGTSLEGQWDIALRDLQHALNLDLDGDGAITWGELQQRRLALTRYALARLRIEAVARGDRANCRLQSQDMLFDRHVDGGYAVLRFTAQCPLRPAQLAVHYWLFFDLDPNHRGLLDVRAGGYDQASVLAAASPDLTLNLGAPERLAQFRAFLDEGIWHIWKGYDHILFLLTLLLPAVVLFHNGRW